MRRVNIDPSGLQSATEIGIDGTRRIAYADGTVTSVTAGPDPRFGTQAPVARTLSLSTPSGLTSVIQHVRSLSPVHRPPQIIPPRTPSLSMVDPTSELSKPPDDDYQRTPMGRQMVSLLDGRGRVIEQRVAGLEPLRFTYSPIGELVAVAQSSRHTVFGYDAQGRLATINDPLGHTVGFQYDAVGRVTRQVLPDGREVLSSYDANGNTSSLTPPGRPSHAFTYTAIDLEESYISPAVGAEPTLTHTTYNLIINLPR
jgi:YD repeat-containing protein